MSTDTTAPDTIVLVHGLWMTPRSWEEWVPYYERKGYKVITPTYPGFEVEVAALREDPTPIATATVPATVAHIADAITELDAPPIIMGHSFGGTLTQLLLDRGCGAAGVVIDSAPTEGVHVSPLSQIKSLFPALKDPRNRHKAFGFTPEEFHYAFTNTLSEEESLKVYDRFHIPAPGNWIWAYGLIANFQARTPGDVGELQEPESRSAPLHRRRRGSHHAPVGQRVEREALQGRRHDHRVLRVRGSRSLDVWCRGMGSRRGSCARVGGRARHGR